MRGFLRSFLRASSFFCFFFFGSQGLAPAQTSGERAADREAIDVVLRAQQSAWNRADVDAFLEGYWYSPELTFSGSSGVARGWDAVLARYKKNYPDRAAMGQLSFSDFEFRFLGPDAALVLGKWHLQREKDELGGVFTLVWQRFPEGWKIIHDHTSAVVSPKKNQ
jgi:ketosteroid isomerase-like protein